MLASDDVNRTPTTLLRVPSNRWLGIDLSVQDLEMPERNVFVLVNEVVKLAI
jgi:hypothetical protein